MRFTISFRASLMPLLALAFVTACSSVERSAVGGRHAYTQPHVLRYTMDGDVRGLDAFVHVLAPEAYLGELCAAYLTRTDARGDSTIPELAVAVPTQENGGISRDGKTVTWHLRRGVKWSDGAAFTADDVVFSTKQVLNPANDIDDRDGWDLITNIDEPDKYTVVYRLKRPYSPFALQFFSSASARAIVPEHLLHTYKNLNDVPYNAMPVGIGPFKYAKWNRGESIVVVRNAEYWRGQPKLERIVFEIRSDRNAMATQMRTHDLDLWLNVGSHFYPELSRYGGIAGVARPASSYDHLDFNVSRPILRDIAVRKALRYAFDRETIVRKVRHGLATLSESYIPATSKFYVPISRIPFDIARANALLDDDGWKRAADGVRGKAGRRLELELAAPTGVADEDQAIEVIRASWQRIGVELQVHHYAYATLYGPAEQGGIVKGGNFDVTMFVWNTDSLPDVTARYGCLSLAPQGWNVLRWCDRVANAQMERLETTYRFGEQKAASDATVHAIVDEVPTIVMDLRQQLAAENDDLRHFNPNAVAPFDSMMDVDI